MKNPHEFEAVAAVCGIVGAVVLASGLMPFINPGFVDINTTGGYSPRMDFLLPTLLSLPILGLSWHFNKKAQALRRELETTQRAQQAPIEEETKWVLFGIMMLFVLYAFL